MKLLNQPSSVGAEYAAPTGLDFILVCGSTNMPRRWRFAVLESGCVESAPLCFRLWGKTMKHLSIFFCAVFLTFATSPSRAQCVIPSPTSSPNYPPAIIDEITGQPLSSTATKCIVLIHGWNPSSAVNCYGGEFSSLLINLKARLTGTGWSIVAYDWHQDASTGYIGDSIPTSIPQFLFAHANQAAANAQLHGDHLATMLDSAAPDLREVQFIAHSAGTHAAKEAMIQMLQLNPYVIVQTTFLDPYIPCPADSLGNFSDYAMDELQFTTGNNRIQRLENYYANDDPAHGWNAFPWGSWTGPTLNTQERFYWRTGIDINQEVDWGATLVNPVLSGSVFYSANYDWHAGPIQFYADTVDASISGHAASSSLPTGSPYDYRNIGWNRSLYAWESFLPKITTQPANQTVQSGGSVTLTVAANQADNIDWYVFTGNWIGSGPTLTLNNFTAANPRLYVARVSNSYGQLYSRPAVITVGAAASPTITTVSPSTMTGLPTGQTQLIRIIGSGFTSASTLTFNDEVNPSYTGRVPSSWSANELDYNISVGTNQANWSVVVVNGAQTSNLKYFTVTAPTAAPTGSLVVNLSPSGATSAGAQWLLNGSYHNSGDVVTALTPGQYTVSLKSVSGYATPASFSVNIVANAQTTTNATYSAVAATTYTLTLNAANGSVTPSPSGWNGSAYVYNAGSVVQLTAYANTGYHFTNWNGDASGSVNPTTITMNGNKTVSASFASGDPNMANVTVTIKPDTAANAGVTWSVTGDSQLRASGTSLSEAIGTGYTAYLPVTLNLVAGWLGTNGVTSFNVPVIAGIVTNVTLTCVPDTTPGLLTATLSPPDAVTAGAHWHVNGGTYGSGASATLTPGNYTVTFDTVSGWTAPASQPVTMKPAQSIVVPGNYTPPAGQPAIYSISPPMGPTSGGTLLTISGVNFTAPATVLIGGLNASNISVTSATQITCLTPSSSTNGTVSIVVQTGSGSTTNSNGFAYGTAYGSKLDFVNTVGGSCFGADVQGNYAYAGEGRNLIVLNISTPSNPSKTGQVTLPGIIYGVKLLGQYAYVADGEGGLQVVDVSNPSAPKIAGYYSTTNYLYTRGLSIYGGTVYATDDTGGFEIFSLGNPTSPTLLSSTNINVGYVVGNVIIKGSANGTFAYVSTGSGLYVIDVSNPAAPVVHSHTSTSSMYSITLSGNYVIGACLNDYSIHMVNVSNPDSLIDVSINNTSGTGFSAVAVANNYLYAESTFTGIGFVVYSISGTNLTMVGQSASLLSDGGIADKMIVSGSQIYTMAGLLGLQIVNISSPFAPSLLTSFTDSGLYASYWSVAVTGNALCASDYKNFKVFDASQLSMPLVANLTGMGAANRLVAQNGIAYLKASDGTRLYSVATPSSPQFKSTISNSVVYPYGMQIIGTTLYIVGYNGSGARFVAVDVSNPSAPVTRGTKDFPDTGYALAQTVAVNGSKALVGLVGGRISFLDISTISSPVERGSMTTAIPYDIRISPDGNYAYFVEAENPSFLHVLNISSLSSPSVVTNVPLDISQALSLDLRGSELFVGTGRELYVFDISNPASPVLTRSYLMSGISQSGICAPTDTASQSAYIYIADNNGGVVALSEEDIQAPDIYITTPVFAPVYTNISSSIALGGGSDDNVGVTAITWANDRGGSGQVSPPLDSWYVSGIKLYPGSNNITATAFDAAGNRGTDVLTVIYPTTNQNQTITFPAIADHTFGDVPIPLVAAASSGLPVTLRVISGPATLSNSNVLTLTGAGAVTVEANQPGNGSFNSATPVDMNFNVARANQSIAFTPVLNHAAGDAPFALIATTSSGLPVYFNILSGPAINSNNIVTLLGGGAVTAIAWQPGNSNYNAAATVRQIFNVSKIPQTITFGALSQQKVGDAPFPLTAATDSGLPVSFSVSGAAMLSGNIITLTGSGNVTVTASQPGNNTYAAAATVSQSFFVVPPVNTLSSVGLVTNSGFQMAFYGTLGVNYTLQASTDLKNWTSVRVFICTNSPIMVIDPGANYLDKRFYRVVQGVLPIMVKLNPGALPFSKTNGMMMNLDGPLGFNYLIQTSTNLTSWQPWTNFTTTSQPFSFKDWAATNYSRRFYRAVMP